jgi:hypothetical protein
LDRVFFFFRSGLASNCSSPTYVSHVAGITDMSHNAWLIGWDGGVLLTFCPGWLSTSVSACWVAGITGVHLHVRPCFGVSISFFLWFQNSQPCLIFPWANIKTFLLEYPDFCMSVVTWC